MDNCQGRKYGAVRARGESVWSAEIDGPPTLKIAAIKAVRQKDGAPAPVEPIPHMTRKGSLQEDEREPYLEPQARPSVMGGAAGEMMTSAHSQYNSAHGGVCGARPRESLWK